MRSLCAEPQQNDLAGPDLNVDESKAERHWNPHGTVGSENRSGQLNAILEPQALLDLLPGGIDHNHQAITSVSQLITERLTLARIAAHDFRYRAACVEVVHALECVFHPAHVLIVEQIRIAIEVRLAAVPQQ